MGEGIIVFKSFEEKGEPERKKPQDFEPRAVHPA